MTPRAHNPAPLFRSFLLGRFDAVPDLQHIRFALQDYRRLSSLGIRSAIETVPEHREAFRCLLGAAAESGIQLAWDLSGQKEPPHWFSCEARREPMLVLGVPDSEATAVDCSGLENLSQVWRTIRRVYRQMNGPVFVIGTGRQIQGLGAQVSRAVRSGVPVEGICLRSVLEAATRPVDSLWGPADQTGNRPINAVLAEEIAAQLAVPTFASEWQLPASLRAGWQEPPESEESDVEMDRMERERAEDAARREDH